MSILAQNIRVIRRELKCTQSAMASVLNMGFRTYIRYEAGERDAPVAVIVKLARLGNVPLERLLTRQLTALDIVPAVNKDNSTKAAPRIKKCLFASGEIQFAAPPGSGLLSRDEEERKLLAIYRKMRPDLRRQCLVKADELLAMSRMGAKSLRAKIQKEVAAQKKKTSAPMLVKSVSVDLSRLKAKGKPGRKKQAAARASRAFRRKT